MGKSKKKVKMINGIPTSPHKKRQKELAFKETVGKTNKKIKSKTAKKLEYEVAAKPWNSKFNEGFINHMHKYGDDSYDHNVFDPSIYTMGNSSAPGGLKFDDGKSPLDLIPYDALYEIGMVLLAGEEKYGTANWARGLRIRRLISASLRHIGQFNNGEDYDEETKTIHLANACTNLMMAIWMFKNRPDMDDRWIKTIKVKNENNQE